MTVKELPKVIRDNIIKKQLNGKSYRAIAKTLNIPVSTIGSIISRWKVHGTTNNHLWTGAPNKISQHAFANDKEDKKEASSHLKRQTKSSRNNSYTEHYKQ